MKKKIQHFIAVTTLLLVLAAAAHSQSEYANCYEDPFDNRYSCDARSVSHAQFESFAWYVTIPSGYLHYMVQIQHFGSGYGYVFMSGANSPLLVETSNSASVSEDGYLYEGTSPAWVDGEVYIDNGELTMTAFW